MRFKLIITPCDDDHWDNEQHENAVNMFLEGHSATSVRTSIHLSHKTDGGTQEAYMTEILYTE